MGIDNTLFGVLYSAQMYPEIFMPLFGGVLIDRLLGMKLGIFLVTLVVLLGQIVMSAGAFVDVFWVMIIGRTTMGFGNGLLTTVIFSYQTILFRHNLSLVMSIGFTCSRLGATLAISFSQTIYDWLAFVTLQNYRLGLVLSLGNISMLGSIVCVILLILLDKKQEGEDPQLVDETQRNCINIQDLKDFSLNFWLVFLSLSLFYGVIFSFVSNGQLLFVSKFGLTVNEANIANSIIYFVTIFFNPVVGKLINVYGFHLLWCFVGIILKILFLLIVFVTSKPAFMFLPYLMGIINGLGYSCFVIGIWPIVPRIVKKHQLNTAYGILNCSWIGPVVSVSAGAIIDHVGYLMQGIFYLILLFVSCSSLLGLMESRKTRD